MKRDRLLKIVRFALFAAVPLALGLSGCNKTEEAPPAKAAVEAVKTEAEHPAKAEAVKPAADKPKDHPAH